MRRVMVRYRVKPDQVAENEQLVRDVYEELARVRPDGFRYGTFKLEDGVSFVHVASQEGEEPARRRSPRSGASRRTSASAATSRRS